jgi:hypothetical protein
MAGPDCMRLSADNHSFAGDAKELPALSELCIFGQQFEPARASLVAYLALPEPPERKLAMVLLIRAQRGLNQPAGADLQLDALMRDYPYDAHAFTLWAPSTLDVVRDLAQLLPQQQIWAITSWMANTGQLDVPSDPTFTALHSLQQSLPTHVSVLVVPDSQLAAFHADAFPAGIIIRDGMVRSNGPLSGHGSERMLVHTLSDSAESPLAAP